MIRHVTLLLAGALLAGASPTPTTVRAASVGIVEGPAVAAHRLTVISAYSCPFCRIFDQQAMSELRRTWTRRGVQVEHVPVLLSPTDLATSIAATCGDPRGYARRSTILYRAQSEILGNWNGAPETSRRAAAAKAGGSGAVEIARLSGLPALAPSLGLTRERLHRCLTDPEQQSRPAERQRRAQARWDYAGTPTVFLDDRRVGNSWAEARAALMVASGDRSKS